MPQDALAQLRSLMREIDPFDKAELARVWRSAYVDVPQFALHRLHALAFEYGIAEETAPDWIDEEGVDVHEPSTTVSGQRLDEYGLTRTIYHRGYAISTRVDPDQRAWRSSVRAEASDGTVIFAASDEGMPSIGAAYQAAVQQAMDAIAGVAD